MGSKPGVLEGPWGGKEGKQLDARGHRLISLRGGPQLAEGPQVA